MRPPSSSAFSSGVRFFSMDSPLSMVREAYLQNLDELIELAGAIRQDIQSTL